MSSAIASWDLPTKLLSCLGFELPNFGRLAPSFTWGPPVEQVITGLMALEDLCKRTRECSVRSRWRINSRRNVNYQKSAHREWSDSLKLLGWVGSEIRSDTDSILVPVFCLVIYLRADFFSARVDSTITKAEQYFIKWQHHLEYRFAFGFQFIQWPFARVRNIWQTT